jgi:hypothetical protein
MVFVMSCIGRRVEIGDVVPKQNIRKSAKADSRISHRIYPCYGDTPYALSNQNKAFVEVSNSGSVLRDVRSTTSTDRLFRSLPWSMPSVIIHHRSHHSSNFIAKRNLVSPPEGGSAMRARTSTQLAVLQVLSRNWLFLPLRKAWLSVYKDALSWLALFGRHASLFLQFPWST